MSNTFIELPDAVSRALATPPTDLRALRTARRSRGIVVVAPDEPRPQPPVPEPCPSSTDEEDEIDDADEADESDADAEAGADDVAIVAPREPCESKGAPVRSHRRCGAQHKLFMKSLLSADGAPVIIKPNALRSLGALGVNSVARVYTHRLGEVSLPCFDRGDGTVDLYTIVQGMAGQPDIIVKGIDARANKLNAEGIMYTLQGLARKPTTRVSITECKKNHDTIQRLKGKIPLSPTEAAALLAARVYNEAVDIHFLSCLFLQFLQLEVGINNSTNTNVLFSLHNVPRLDNAFFTGSYMVYGNGDQMFQPLGSIDVIGHEQFHGVNKLLAKSMPYVGDSGALDESGADIGGRKFEAWVYTRFNKNLDPADNIPGEDDWLLGEDIAKMYSFLRNMQDPTKATPPQPAVYRGQYWADPNSKIDYGNVHTNSGPANRCFFLLSSSVGMDLAFKIYLRALRSLPALPTYINFRDAYLASAAGYGKTVEVRAALDTVGLGAAAINDWRKIATS